MAVTGTISSKGQITVPAVVRRRLGVGAGDRVEFFFDGQQTVLRPVRPEGNSFEKWMGIAPELGSAEAVDGWISGMRDDEERTADLRELSAENGH